MKLAFGAIIAALSIAAAVPSPSVAEMNRTDGFAGNWCAFGDTTKPERIVASGPLGIHLRNFDGATASGTLTGPASHTVVVAKWKYLRGNLSADAQTISWSNNTFWKRCSVTVKK